MYKININTDEVVGLTNKLEKLRKSALPAAILGTLNGTVFKMKTVTMPKKAKEMFVERQPNFFKANSKFEKATGFNINTMVATMGMVSSGLQNKETNYAVKDLEQQEYGGTIHGRSFKPLAGARKGGTGNVRPNARISQILKAGNVINARDSIGQNKMQKMIKASIQAGVGGYVLSDRILFRVKGIKRLGRNSSFKMEKLFSFKKSGVAKVKATGFMRAAALEVQKEMEELYKKEAIRQVNKVMK